MLRTVLDRCAAARFTGIVRIRARQGEGEVGLLSGMVDSARFGVSAGDEAIERLLGAADPKLEIVARLPHPSGGFKKQFPTEGELGPDLRPNDLFRYCESSALSCSLEIESSSGSGVATYRLGELLGVTSAAGTDGAVADMLSWTEGRYRFELPVVELQPQAPDAAPQAARAIASARPAAPVPRPQPAAIPRSATAEADLKLKAQALARELGVDAPAVIEKVHVGRIIEIGDPAPMAEAVPEPAPAPEPARVPEPVAEPVAPIEEVAVAPSDAPAEEPPPPIAEPPAPPPVEAASPVAAPIAESIQEPAVPERAARASVPSDAIVAPRRRSYTGVVVLLLLLALAGAGYFLYFVKGYRFPPYLP